MIIIITILFLTLYSFSAIQLFNRVESEETSYYHELIHTHGFNTFQSESNYSANEYINNISQDCHDIKNFAWGVAIYNENCEIVAKTGSFISINSLNENEVIYIDKYLTPEIKKQVADYKNSFKYYYPMIVLDKINYIEKDNQKIPVSIVISNSSRELEPLEIKFSDEKNFKTISASDEYSLWIRFIDIDENNYIHKLFNEVNDYLDNFDKNEIKNMFFTQSGGGGVFPNETSFEEFEQFTDGNYVLISKTAFSPIVETLKSATFREIMITQTICYVVFYFFAVLSLSVYFKKSKKLDNTKTAFTNAAAHELKTPLSVIENQCECIMENVAPEKNAEYLNSIYAEALRMNKLVASLLQYNRLASADTIKMEKCRLDEIVNAEIEKYQAYLTTKNIRLETNINNNLTIKCNAELIALVIDNYLSNAVKHTDNGNLIRITLNSNKFVVYNEGKNIPSEYRDTLFNVLYKTDKARTREDNSTGMGLAICKEILEQHKFKYGYSNKRDGVEFYFTT